MNCFAGLDKRDRLYSSECEVVLVSRHLPKNASILSQAELSNSWRNTRVIANKNATEPAVCELLGRDNRSDTRIQWKVEC